MLNRCITVFAIAVLGGLSVTWDSLQAQTTCRDSARAGGLRSRHPADPSEHLLRMSRPEEGEGEAAPRLPRRDHEGRRNRRDRRSGQQREEPDRPPPARPRRRRPHAEGRRSAAGRADRPDSIVDRSRRPLAGHGRRGDRFPERRARRFRRTGPIAGRPVPRSPMCAGRNGCERRSIASSWPGSRRKG